jgi:hypothetical protein
VEGAETDFAVLEVDGVVGGPHVFSEGCWDGLFAVVDELFEDVVFLDGARIGSVTAHNPVSNEISN